MKAQLLVLILILGLVSMASAQPVNWTQMGNAVHPFGIAASGVLGNYLYCFGNMVEFGYSYSAQAYNLTTGQWEESTLPPMAWAHCQGVATDSAIYLIGGYNPSMGNTWEVWKFMPIGGGPTGTWTQVANYLWPARAMASAWDGGNFIYTAGGASNYAQFTAEACKYDMAGNQWAQIASLPNVVNYAGGAFVLGKFYVLGGGPFGNTMYEYDPTSNTWVQKASSPTMVVMAIYCTTFNDSLIIAVGGGGGGPPPSNAVQIYNPLTDTWYEETPLPEAVMVNAARWIGGGEIISAGGAIGQWIAINTTYRGAGFPSGSPPATLSITLSAINPPITIPARGGSFNFNISMQRTVGPQAPYAVWARIKNPNGTYTAPTLGPVTINTPVGVTITRQRTQTVPGSWVAGLYTYLGYVNPTYGYPAMDSSSFTWTKSVTADGGPWITEASCTGEPFPGKEAVNLQPTAFSLLKASPNPFNPTTAISYQLQAASHVSLKVFDTAGRLVATLVNGWRETGSHEVTFDGSGLPSGIYFAKLAAGDFNQVQKMVLMK